MGSGYPKGLSDYGTPGAFRGPRRDSRARFNVGGRGGFRGDPSEAAARRLPYLDDGMLEIERPTPPPRRVEAPRPSRPVEVPEQVLRIMVGDLAPQAQSVFRFVQTNDLANTATSVGSVALGALIIPALLR
jgi:hypothetical protein